VSQPRSPRCGVTHVTLAVARVLQSNDVEIAKLRDECTRLQTMNYELLLHLRVMNAATTGLSGPHIGDVF
jgi:hypothetical protein